VSMRRFQIGCVNAEIPDRPRQSQSAGGATDGSPARKGWVRWPEEVRAPEVRHISDFAPFSGRRNRLRNKPFVILLSEASLPLQNKSRRERIRLPRAQNDGISHFCSNAFNRRRQLWLRPGCAAVLPGKAVVLGRPHSTLPSYRGSLSGRLCIAEQFVQPRLGRTVGNRIPVVNPARWARNSARPENSGLASGLAV
jgi:hypothetical protein